MEKITQQIKNLNSIKPRDEWRDSFRDILLSHIKRDAAYKSNVLHPFIYIKSFFTITREKVMQPASLLLLMFGLVLGTSLTVNAAFYSLPGQPLYKLKISLERTQLVFVMDNSRVTELKMEFAKKRVDELEKIVAQNSLPEAKKANATIAINNFKKEVDSVKNYVRTLKPEKKDQASAFRVALAINSETSKLAKTLGKQADDLSKSIDGEIAKNIKEAVQTAENTSFSALEAVVQISSTSTSPLPQGDVSKALQDKALSIEGWLDELKEQISESTQNISIETANTILSLEELLEQSKIAISENKYNKALENITTINNELHKLQAGQLYEEQGTQDAPSVINNLQEFSENNNISFEEFEVNTSTTPQQSAHNSNSENLLETTAKYITISL